MFPQIRYDIQMFEKILYDEYSINISGPLRAFTANDIHYKGPPILLGNNRTRTS